MGALDVDVSTNTLLLTLHLKRISLSPASERYLNSPMELVWTLEGVDGNGMQYNTGSKVSNLVKLDTPNVGTLYMVTKVNWFHDKLVFADDLNLKLDLILVGEERTTLASISYGLNELEVSSRLNPFSFKLATKDSQPFADVDVIYASQPRWACINKNVLHEASTLHWNENELCNVTTAVNKSGFSLLYWNSSDSCFVNWDANDIQLKFTNLLFSSLIKNNKLNVGSSLNVNDIDRVFLNSQDDRNNLMGFLTQLPNFQNLLLFPDVIGAPFPLVNDAVTVTLSESVLNKLVGEFPVTKLNHAIPEPVKDNHGADKAILLHTDTMSTTFTLPTNRDISLETLSNEPLADEATVKAELGDNTEDELTNLQVPPGDINGNPSPRCYLTGNDPAEEVSVDVREGTDLDEYFHGFKNAHFILEEDVEYIDDSTLEDYGYIYDRLENGNYVLHCENSVLDYDKMSSDLRIISHLHLVSREEEDAEVYDLKLLTNAFEDAKILKTHYKTLPTPALLHYYTKFLDFYTWRGVHLASYLQIITLKQLDTLKEQFTDPKNLMIYLSVALNLLVNELENMVIDLQGDYSEDWCEELDVKMDTTSPFPLVKPNRDVSLQNIISAMYSDTDQINPRKLNSERRLVQKPDKDRGCLFTFEDIKTVLYSTFCGRSR